MLVRKGYRASDKGHASQCWKWLQQEHKDVIPNQVSSQTFFLNARSLVNFLSQKGVDAWTPFLLQVDEITNYTDPEFIAMRESVITNFYHLGVLLTTNFKGVNGVTDDDVRMLFLECTKFMVNDLRLLSSLMFTKHVFNQLCLNILKFETTVILC